MTSHLIRSRSLRTIAGLGLAATLVAGSAAAMTPVKSYKDIKTQPIDWQKPEPEVVKLDNGATLYLLEDHRLPRVNFYGVVRTGSLYDPDGKSGTASLLGSVLRTGGTKKRTWQEVDETVDALAMSVTTGIGTESGNATFTVLSENFEPALNLLFEMLREPAFDPEKVTLAKEKIKEGIRRQNDNPIQIALREMRKVMYGADHPRGFASTFKSVDAITTDDLTAFHQKYYVPSNMILGVAGDFDRSKIETQVAAAMKGWSSHEVTLPDVPSFELSKPSTIHLAPKENLAQSTILIERMTIKQGDPDQVALEVMDYILGSGGFTSRITNAVRNERGLAYAAGSFLNIGNLDPGPEVVYALSKGESTVEALEVSLGEIARMRDEAVPEDELERAKNAILNGAVFDYDKPQKIIAETINLSYYGLPQDGPEKRLKELGTVSSADVQRVAGEYLPAESLQIMVVGAPSKFDKPLTTVGEVKEIELKDPTVQ